MKAMIGWVSAIALGAFAFAAMGGKRPARKQSLDALIDTVWIFRVVDDAQAQRVIAGFEQHGQVLGMSFDGSRLEIKFRAPRRWSQFPRGGFFDEEFEDGMRLLGAPPKGAT